MGTVGLEIANDAWLGIGLGLLLCLGLFVVMMVRNRRRNGQAYSLNLSATEHSAVSEISLALLEEISRMVDGVTFHAYWLKPGQNNYHLRASLKPVQKVEVSLHYAGMATDVEQSAPLIVRGEGLGRRVEIVQDDRGPILVLPFGDFLLIYVGLNKNHKIRSREIRRWQQTIERYHMILFAFYKWFTAEDAMKRLRELSSGTSQALDVTLKAESSVEALMQIAVNLVQAETSFALIFRNDLTSWVIGTDSAGLELVERMRLQKMESSLLVMGQEPDVLLRGDFDLEGTAYLSCVRVPLVAQNETLGCMFLWGDRSVRLSNYDRSTLQVLGLRAGQILRNQAEMKRVTDGYVGTLQTLVVSMDMMDPHQVGRSSRIAKWARRIAEVMQLSTAEIESIALAAELHDVGMITLENRVRLKSGRYSASEYQRMQLHADLGSQLVQSLPNVPEIGPLIAAHHERWDGAGYPRGLLREQIPLGARIVYVAENLDAKSTSRSYRAPLSFEQVMREMKEGAGSAYDPEVVGALIEAVQRQQDYAQDGLPLEPCWQWKGLSEHICQSCPNHTREAVRCWESPVNLCQRHGDRCETCVVYTEAMARSQAKLFDAPSYAIGKVN